MFHAADDLFGEAIALALSRDDPRSAFAYAERARARALFDTLAVPWRPVEPADVPARSAVVEYAVHGDTIFIFVVDERGVRAVRQHVARPALDAEIAAILDAAGPSAQAGLETAGRALYGRLVAPIERELAGTQTLVIVPDRTLQSLPFAALMDGAGTYLIERYAIAVEPSAAFFVRSRAPRQRSSAGSALIVTGGDEELGRLSAADQETRAIARLYRDAVPLGRDVATPAAVLREARKAETIHFAGHSIAASERGQGGYLVLARDGAGDGRLDLNEIASASFPATSLVVLAACDTAAGPVRATEGTISIARAFLAAGVPTVVATLWPIEDQASAEFFPAFHQRLARGASPKDALRETQIEWIRSNRPAALWAGVQILGQ